MKLNILKLVVVLSLGLMFFGSCKKDDTQKCMAHAADGTELYEVEGKDVCESQINKANGEYCDCTNE